MATLKDIGAELGLSVATVSRALNGFPEVNAKTREKVRQTAERLGYRPNRVAQRLVTGRSGMVGMIVKLNPDMSSDQTFFEVVAGLSAALAARDTDLVLAVDQGTDPVAAYARMLERDILDGFILNAPVPDDPRVAFLQSRNIPFVMHGTTGEAADYPFFAIDNQAVSRDAVNLLTALGHRRIALLNGEHRYAFAQDRAEGFRQAMPVSMPDHFMACHPPSEPAGYAQALTWLSGQQGPRPTAILCSATPQAAGVYRAAKDLGIQIPRDLSVVAHDDGFPQMPATGFAPSLTVTQAPFRDACEPLTAALLGYIEGRSARDLQTTLRADLVLHNSTGPVPHDQKTPWPIAQS